MKQFIDILQAHELSVESRKRLYDWYVVKDFKEMRIDEHYIPMLSIGQMIEFLDEYDNQLLAQVINDRIAWRGTDLATMETESICIESQDDDELSFCDALWEAVKEVLRK